MCNIVFRLKTLNINYLNKSVTRNKNVTAFFHMNTLNVKISFFKNCYAGTEPINGGTFFDVVTSEKLPKQYRPLLDRIKAEPDKKKRGTLKERLPIFTPSGIFSERKAEGLISHSGLLSFDLDSDGNPFLNADTVERVKAELSKLPEVAYMQTSASGTGLWGVIPLAYPDRHKEQFEALEVAFAEQGYKIDSACSDVCRARFWSYDPAPYFNLEARKFTGLPKPKPARPVYVRDTERPNDLAMQAAEYLIKNRVNLECTYTNFRNIMFACKNEWGEAGKDIALDILHNCTTFAASNTARNFDTLWRNAKRESGTIYTGASIVYWAGEGFKSRNQERPAPAHHSPKPNAWQTFTPTQGKPFQQIVTPEGYPAVFDDARPAPEAIAANIRDTTTEPSPAIPDLMERNGWKLDGVFPLDESEAKAWQVSRQRAQAIMSRATSAANKEQQQTKKTRK